MPSKTPSYTALKPGDPWTFTSCTDEQLAIAAKLQEQDRPTARWFNTGEPGRLFRVVKIHPAQRAVETTYLGFQKEPGSDEPAN